MDEPGSTILLIGDNEEKIKATVQKIDNESYCIRVVDADIDINNSVDADLIIIEVEQTEDEERALVEKVFESRRETPIIFLAENKDEKHKKKILSCGATECLIKPVSKEELLNVLDEILNLNKWYKEVNSNGK